MKYSQLFGKTTKTLPKEEVAVNARLLLQGGFVDKLMAGSYTLLPLGRLVERKIEQMVREEINRTGAQEVLMPLLHPKEIWNETGRWETAKEVMYQFEKYEREYALSFTHEEIVLDLIRKHTSSYKDYPIKFYHFSTKFRDEPRAKSGVLRGREFIMKDLYSAHTTEEDLNTYYWQVADAYKRIFERVHLKVKIVEASGGVFTDNYTHEFQMLTDVGEDTIYYCEKCDFAQNKEIANVKTVDKCPKCGGTILESKSIEVGNIFRFGQVYSKKMQVMFTDDSGQREYPFFGSYGIGITRLIGTIVERHHDEKGIIWPQSVAPFSVHLIGLHIDANGIYERLRNSGIEVLYDNREAIGAGEKFADADLIGIPVRLVVSNRTGESVEWKKRTETKTETISLDEAIHRLTKTS